MAVVVASTEETIVCRKAVITLDEVNAFVQSSAPGSNAGFKNGYTINRIKTRKISNTKSVSPGSALISFMSVSSPFFSRTFCELSIHYHLFH